MGEKKDRYTEAFGRIGAAMTDGFFFEAIAIEESILSDRIASFLISTGALPTADVHRMSFSQLIQFWNFATRNPGSIWEQCDNLIGRVDGWRKQRNKYIHGLVKFPGDEVEVETTSSFIEGAKRAAASGAVLSQELWEWRKRQVQLKRSHTLMERRRSESKAGGRGK
jgi:hypothetical protein